MPFLFVSLLLLSLITGCATWVTVKKVTPADKDKVEGVRHSLPGIVLVVKPDPKGDGTAAYELQPFPDVDQTYAISAHSFIATHKADFHIAEGILTKVVWNPNSAAVAEELIKSGGNAVQTELTRRKTEKEKQQQKEEEVADAAKAQVEAAIAAVRTKKRELEIAQLELNLIIKTGVTGDTRNTAELKVLKAELALKHAQEDLNLLQNSVSRDLKINSAEVSNDPTEKPTVFGPLFYKLVDTYNPETKEGSVKLVAAKFPGGETQLSIARGGPAQEPATVQFFTLQADEIVTVSAAKKLIINRSFSFPIAEIDQDISIDGIAKHGTDLGEISLDNNKSLKITLKEPLQASNNPYFLRIPFRKTDGTSDQATITIRVKADPATPKPELTTSGRENIRLAQDKEISISRQLAAANLITDLKFDGPSSFIDCRGNKIEISTTNQIAVTVNTEGVIALQLSPEAPLGTCNAIIGLSYSDKKGEKMQSVVVIELNIIK